MICLFNRYIEAISKYEFVMKIELSVFEYIIRLKERICYCFFKVIVDLFLEM